jgi:hypothetical protein
MMRLCRAQYLRKQEELIGTNGLESMREPFIDARIVVILYRANWGQTPWTSVEEKVIQEKCLHQGWPVIFVRLDKNDPWPRWVSDTRIHFDWQDYPLEQLIGAIKMRVQVAGGAIRPLDAVARAKLVKGEVDLKADQERLFRKHEFIDGSARPLVEQLMKQLCDKAEQINVETGLNLEYGYEPYSSRFICVLRYGRVTTHVLWKQEYSNVIDGVTLECTDYNARIHLVRERMMPLRVPKKLGAKSYHIALNHAREMRWVDPSKPDQLLSNDEMVQRIFDQVLALVDRLNQGKIPSHDFDY